jgi:hypothetical protein
MKNTYWLCLLFLTVQSCTQHEKEVTISPVDTTKTKLVLKAKNPVLLNDMFGINGFEWDFLSNPDNPNDPTHIYEPRMELIKTFTGFRHYIDWDKIESTPGHYTFNPSGKGSWNYDVIYERCKKEGITVLACLKSCPEWLLKTYPEKDRDAENVPAPFGSDLENPASYILQAKAAFQFAARYGSNKNIPANLQSGVVTGLIYPTAPDGGTRTRETGLGYIKYIECDNERDKNWKGKKAYQNPQQYAANLSAFYDGDKGKLGKNVGVKTADPNMQVVMAGLSSADASYVQGMIDWCKKHRGYKPDGSVNLCFDVINYHYYADDRKNHFNHQPKRGIAPELSEAANIADAFVKLGHQYHLPVWVTEAGADINKDSPEGAKAIGNKTIEDTQADWILRTALLYARHGIGKVFFYMLDDVNKDSPVQYSSSGLVSGLSLRPAGEFILQTKNLMGNFQYIQTLSNDPLVDVYASGKKKMYVLTVPDETGRTAICHLNLGNIKQAAIHRLLPDTSMMSKKIVPVVHGKLTITASETPVFVETM